MSRRLFLAFALSLLGFHAAPAQTADNSLKKIAVGIDWFVDPNHGPLVVALERGFFADAGLDVTLVPPENTMGNVTMVLDGRVAIGMSDQPRTQIEVAGGSPLVIIGTLITEPLNVILAVEGGPIKSTEDLRGKRIGYADSQTTESDLLKISLAAHDIPMSEVTLVNVGFAMVPALLEGKVDVLTDAYSNFEPFQVELAGKTPLVLDIEKGAMPAYSELVYIVNRDIVDPDVVDKFLVAVERGAKALVEDPDAAWELFIKYDPKLDNELNRKSWDATVPLFSTNPAKLDKEKFAEFATFLVANDLVAAIPAPEDYLYSP
ncbi:MAG: ABC transporter substrate-binding protein [Hyphomicrobiales bacterium]|nr:ABC transporter substrate-binding protein [Hyphomicrobiales bacterium]MCP4997353.1 ABC transporter substrate-binding protein [Hyphomicrobiales bacterium]